MQEVDKTPIHLLFPYHQLIDLSPLDCMVFKNRHCRIEKKIDGEFKSYGYDFIADEVLMGDKISLNQVSKKYNKWLYKKNIILCEVNGKIIEYYDLKRCKWSHNFKIFDDFSEIEPFRMDSIFDGKFSEFDLKNCKEPVVIRFSHPEAVRKYANF